jgi:hypothetical protein
LLSDTSSEDAFVDLSELRLLDIVAVQYLLVVHDVLDISEAVGEDVAHWLLLLFGS